MSSPRTSRPRVLVEHENPFIRQQQVETLEAAGFRVTSCAGPRAYANQRCPLVEGEGCAKAAVADVVLDGLPLGDIPVYIALRDAFPGRPVVLSMTRAEQQRFPLLDRIAAVVPRNLADDDLIAAVEDALIPPSS